MARPLGCGVSGPPGDLDPAERAGRPVHRPGLLSDGAKTFRWPADSELDQAPERRIAILVPLWHEHRVIGRMLERNLAVIRYSNYDFFVGVYPNDALTVRAVTDSAPGDPRVHLAIVPARRPHLQGRLPQLDLPPHADYEARHGVRFDVVVTHDAEDLIHPRIAAPDQLVLARLRDGADSRAASADAGWAN